MPPLERVYAYRDQGSMGPTRWAPRRVFCTTDAGHADQPGGLFVVKFCQGQSGAAAMISEVVCRRLFELGGIPVLEAVTVEASENFAASWNATRGMPFNIEAGVYFGTRHLSDGAPGPPPSFADLHHPGQLLNIWVFDSWVCNIDRKNQGNLLMVPTQQGKWRLIAADQSDCFCGSEAFASGEWIERMSTRPAAETVFIAEAIAHQGGGTALQAAVALANHSLAQIGSAFEQVHPEWWGRAGVAPDAIEERLTTRLGNLGAILNIEQWGNFNYDQFNGITLL